MKSQAISRNSFQLAAILTAGLILFAVVLAIGAVQPGVRLQDAPIGELLPLANKGDADAQYQAGRRYAEGEGVAQSDEEALRWWRLAAEQEHVGAQYDIGISYLNGYGVAKDEAEAAKWFRLAAEQGYAEAQYNLGTMLFIGEGVPQDHVSGYAWMLTAESQGADIENLSDAEIEMTPVQTAAAKKLSALCVKSAYSDCE